MPLGGASLHMQFIQTELPTFAVALLVPAWTHMVLMMWAEEAVNQPAVPDLGEYLHLLLTSNLESKRATKTKGRVPCLPESFSSRVMSERASRSRHMIFFMATGVHSLTWLCRLLRKSAGGGAGAGRGIRVSA